MLVRSVHNERRPANSKDMDVDFALLENRSETNTICYYLAPATADEV